MRITNSMQFGSIQNNIASTSANVFKYQQQVSSGKSITSAADDPATYDRLMQLRQSTLDSNQYAKAIQQLKTQMQSYEASLGNVNDVVTQAKTFAQRAANDTLGAPEREQLAAQVDLLIDRTMQLANSYENGRYLYAGSKDQAAPFSAVRDGSGKIVDVTYNGDERTSSVRISASANLQGSFSGAEVFGSAPGDESNVMGALIKLRDEIRGGDAKQISARLATLETVGDKALGAWSQVGVRMQHLDNVEQMRQQNLVALSAEQSSIEDANLPEAFTLLTQMQTTYQAALTVASKMGQMNLISRLS